LAPQLAAARHQLDGYKAVRGSLEAKDGVPRYLGLIDSQGHAAVAIGNPDTAGRTATFVPGTGQDMATFDGSNRKSWDMYQATVDADPALSKGDVSVTTWMGYDRPMDLFPGGVAGPGAEWRRGPGHLPLRHARLTRRARSHRHGRRT
jgi:hypothetical protein